MRTAGASSAANSPRNALANRLGSLFFGRSKTPCEKHPQSKKLADLPGPCATQRTHSPLSLVYSDSLSLLLQHALLRCSLAAVPAALSAVALQRPFLPLLHKQSSAAAERRISALLSLRYIYFWNSITTPLAARADRQIFAAAAAACSRAVQVRLAIEPFPSLLLPAACLPAVSYARAELPSGAHCRSFSLAAMECCYPYALVCSMSLALRGCSLILPVSCSWLAAISRTSAFAA